MNEITNQAAENLRMIRELMERTTVYRAISAPTALFSGTLAVVVAAIQIILVRGGTEISAGAFIAIWLGVYAIADAFHAWMLWRDHQKTGEPLLSPKMILAIKLLAPPMLAGGVVGITIGLATEALPLTATFWAIFYGLAVLATMTFSPKSMTIMGIAFLFAGLALLIFRFSIPALQSIPGVELAAWIMGGTFGLVHLAYGLVVKVRACSNSVVEAGASPSV